MLKFIKAPSLWNNCYFLAEEKHMGGLENYRIMDSSGLFMPKVSVFAPKILLFSVIFNIHLSQTKGECKALNGNSPDIFPH